ncbi:nitroreductase [Thiomicrorhabdus immobilis]|uniref:Nitroreductase n=1 Tax=Thiomicrorhabdus immobilis TaxID=2791037 RepID=A0ABM7MCZ6_9GAMM|nr:nitroreductase [Thiomicrorhabdus immobilis]BCN93277.1 nitroreductase [Thiomicrorhabdus immobilis]
MNVSQAIKQRKSTRSYTNQPVDKEIIRTILDTAKYAPSGVNTQPWQVCVVEGNTKEKLSRQMIDAFRAKDTETMDYQYYPTEWIPPYKARRVETGTRLYTALDIKREDKEKCLKQWEANYNAFGAPVMLLFFIDSSLETGSYLDYGMFLQNIMLLAEENGLATCPQGALGEFPSLVKQTLQIDADKKLIGGMALGYEDKSHLVNQYRTSRIELDEFCAFYD